MAKKSPGFIFLEVIASIIIVIVGGLSVMSCYRFGVTFMLRNNYKYEAFTLAQENMLLLRETNFSAMLDKTQGNFKIIGSKQIVDMKSGYKVLLVEVYWKKETIPLVNLVGYE